jgi:hypothetical protein
MFLRESLLEKLEAIVRTGTNFRDFASDRIQVLEFGQDDFDSSSSEETIIVHRGSKSDFSDALGFWLASLFSQDWLGRDEYALPYAREGLCLEINETEFETLVKAYSSSLRTPLKLPLSRGFRAGLKMYDDWNDVAALAELEDGFVAFYWSTTA